VFRVWSEGSGSRASGRGIVVLPVPPWYKTLQLGSHLTRIDSCITQVEAQGSSRTCNDSEVRVEGFSHSRETTSSITHSSFPLSTSFTTPARVSNFRLGCFISFHLFLWFMISGFMLLVSGSGVRLSGFGFWVTSFRFGVSEFGFRVEGGS